MGIEQDILVDHPEHEMLFVAVQVVRSAGLKEPATQRRSENLTGVYATIQAAIAKGSTIPATNPPPALEGRTRSDQWHDFVYVSIFQSMVSLCHYLNYLAQRLSVKKGFYVACTLSVHD